MQQDESPAGPIYESLKARCSHQGLLAGGTLLGNQPAGGAGWDSRRVAWRKSISILQGWYTANEGH